MKWRTIVQFLLRFLGPEISMFEELELIIISMLEKNWIICLRRLERIEKIEWYLERF